VLFAHTLTEVRGVVEAAHAAALAGNWCVGYLAFESAPAFDAAFIVHSQTTQPLAWFAVYEQALPWPEPVAADVTVDWSAPLARERFDAALARIHAAIGAGDLYQVNYTAQMHGARRDVAATDAAACGPALFAALQFLGGVKQVAGMWIVPAPAALMLPYLLFLWRAQSRC
jgi:para-aminobenzoate synthetase/4-amino-4-deoxychorismate lyase